jgi:hypothetical protein
MVRLSPQMDGVIFTGNVMFGFEQDDTSQQAAFDWVSAAPPSSCSATCSKCCTCMSLIEDDLSGCARIPFSVG